MALGRVRGFQSAILRTAMDRTGYSVDALAVATGVTPQAVRGWLNGSYKPGADAVRQLGLALEIDPLELSGKTVITATLVDLRQRAGLTGSEAAEQVELIPSQLYALEQAVTSPKLEHLDLLAQPYDADRETIRRSWVNRRIERFGRESLSRLPGDLAAELGATE